MPQIAYVKTLAIVTAGLAYILLEDVIIIPPTNKPITRDVYFDLPLTKEIIAPNKTNVQINSDSTLGNETI